MEPRCGRRGVFDSARSRRRRRWSDLLRELFFNGRPAVSLPVPDGLFITLQGTPVGRWQLQPNCPRILQTCPGWYRTPHRLSMRSATRAAVHRLVWYPRASGPRLSPSSIRRRSLSCSNGFRPARPAFFNARRPPLVSCRAQRFTDWRCTPTWRATSASLSPFCSRAAARKRRFSKASKSRLTPAGFPMPRILPAMTGNVTILCEPQ